MSITATQLAGLLSGKFIGPEIELPRVSVPIIDSRLIVPGSIFVAVEGSKVDGHLYLDQAFNQGAAVAIVSRAEVLAGRPGIVVADTRVSLSRLAALAFDHPSKNMFVVGITGTKGKTTTNWMCMNLLAALGRPCLRIGTLGAYAKDLIDEPDTLTTPDAVSLQGLFAKAKDRLRAAVLEVSAHGLTQARVDDVAFDVGVFTNLTRDHLDYYASFDEYFAAKRGLFELVKRAGKTKGAVVNVLTEYGLRIAEDCERLGLKLLSVGSDANVSLRIEDFVQDFAGSHFSLTYQGKTYPVRHAFIGYHNAENIVCAIGCCLLAGFKLPEILKKVADIPQVPGRLQAVPVGQRGVYVDYAHAPDPLEKVLLTLKDLKPRKIGLVFGCGGDRDKGKRPLMGKIAADQADFVVVTSDNPRTENPQTIIEEIISGIDQKMRHKVKIEADRRKAIELALGMTGPGDVLLIAGKGHEQYQIFGTEKTHFCDVEEVQRALCQ